MPLAKDLSSALCIVGSTLVLVLGILVHRGPTDILTYHPVLMTIGWNLILPFGYWIFNYEELPYEEWKPRARRRQLHIACQVSGSLCVALGYLAVCLAHSRNAGTRLFHVDRPPMGFDYKMPGSSVYQVARPFAQAHVVLGYTGLCMLPVQLLMGAWKYFRRYRRCGEERPDDCPVHEFLGNIAYIAGALNVLIGLWLWDAMSHPVRFLISIVVLCGYGLGLRWGRTSAECPATPSAPELDDDEG
mmetsp:Transcript_19948/g.61610  ORF Transcript_19948/g.61610 Transcript_19948/m.61610 type:complete len:245 (+) Transcript_19948:173-907(+)